MPYLKGSSHQPRNTNTISAKRVQDQSNAQDSRQIRLQLLQHIIIHAPIARVFDLVRSVDAHTATSSTIGGRAVAGKTTGLAEVNDVTTYSARFFGLRFSLATRVTAINSPHRIIETLERGLFQTFGHEYTLRPLEPDAVDLTDAFSFRSPFGFIGTLFDALILKPTMTRAMTARLEGLKRIAEGDEWRRFLPDAERLK
jgi:ribosome-associated toxin RatA of RatAB toxin-antitoxin module